MKLNRFNNFFKRNYFFIIVIIVSFLPFLSIFFTPKMPFVQDGLVHLARIAAYFKALSDGQIPVRWAGDLNYGYGMPLFNFMYHLPYVISSVFIFLGFGLVSSFKLTLFISYLLSGIFMFLFAKILLGDNKKAFLVTIFYQFFPFRLSEILVRGAFGEIFTYSFIPLVLLGITLQINNKVKGKIGLLKKFSLKYFLITSVGTFLLVLSHNALSLIFFITSVLFIIFTAKKKEDYIYCVSSLIFGLLLSAYYWMPAILEHRYTYGDLFMKAVYKDNFPTLVKLFIPDLFNNNPNLRAGGVPVQIGLFNIIVFLLSVFFLIKNKFEKNKRIFIFSLIVFLSALIFMQPVSTIFWEKISFLRQFQFPWRFLGVVSIAASLSSLSLYYLPVFKKNFFYYFIITAVIISTVNFWHPYLGYKDVNEKYYWNFPLTSTFYGETDLIWSEGPAKSYPKNRVEIIDGEGIVKNFQNKSNSQTFNLLLMKDSYLVDHVQYFPGWRVYVDKNPVPIQFQNQNHRGEITFYVSKGKHNMNVNFGESKIRLFADLLSLSSFAGIVLLVWIYAKRRYL